MVVRLCVKSAKSLVTCPGCIPPLTKSQLGLAPASPQPCQISSINHGWTDRWISLDITLVQLVI